MESRKFCCKRVSGHFPQSGAIFMADYSTRKECFQRKVFGLPSGFAKFVMQIKIGMVLFLFDHQEKKLYGVFKATSDGGMNIEPHAYKSSRKHFPAQVCFRVMWRCAPIPEEAFRDAIEENYFAPFKFNFGLSTDQVKRLLVVFKRRRVENWAPHNLVWKREGKMRSNETNSEVESKLNSQDDSESFPEKPALSAISDDGNATESDVCKPMSSIDTKEIESLLPDGLSGEDFIPLPSINLEEIENPIPLVEDFSNLFENQQEYDALQLAIDSLFSEVEGFPLKEPGHQNDDRVGGDKQIDNGCGYGVNGLYSDGLNKRRSVFQRLRGLSKAKKQEGGYQRNEMNDFREVQERFDEDEKMWKKVSTAYQEPNGSKSRHSVFSRLNYNIRQTPPEREGSGRMPTYENKWTGIPVEFPQKKRKNHLMGTECFIATKEEMCETKKIKCTGKDPSEINISDHSAKWLVLPTESSSSTINNGSCSASCKSDKRSTEIPVEDSNFGELADPNESCYASARKSILFCNHERDLEFPSINAGSSSEVCPIITQQNTENP